MIRWIVVVRGGTELNISQEQIRNQCIIVVVFIDSVPLLDLVCMMVTQHLMSGKQSGISSIAQHTGKISVAVDKM